MAKISFQGKKNIFSKIGKKNIVVLCALLIIGVAVYLNYIFFFSGDKPSDTVDPSGNVDNMSETTTDLDSYFTATELSRRQARDEALEVLQTVLDNENALQETKAQALEDMSRIATEIETESRIETLVTAKGFEQCIAVVNGESASVVVKCDGELMASQLAQINEIVYNEAGILPSNLKIIQK